MADGDGGGRPGRFSSPESRAALRKLAVYSLVLWGVPALLLALVYLAPHAPNAAVPLGVAAVIAVNVVLYLYIRSVWNEPEADGEKED